jgi:hypothetical protein
MANTVGILGAIEKAKLEFRVNTDDGVKKGQLSVQFNPSSIKFDAATEAVPVKSYLDHFDEVPAIQTRDPSIILNVELIFDAVQNANAFHQDSLRMSTVSDITSQIGAGLSHSEDEKSQTNYSVMEQTNLLIGMTALTPTVVFTWGNQEFGGKINSVRARYEMFSPQGYPIRSRIDLRIEQVLADGSGGTDWGQKYLDFFNNPDAVRKHGKSALQTQSILNLNGY